MSPLARRHAVVAVLAGLASALYVALVVALQPPTASPDFDLWWVAARAWRLGADPYAAVLAAGWQWPLYYPGTMVVAIAPFSVLSHTTARIVVMGLGAGLFAWAIQVTGRSLWLLASGAFVGTLYVAQAGAWLVAAAAIPPLGFVLTCKPTLGLALGLPYLRPGHVVSAVLFIALSLLLFPAWPGEWLIAIRHTPDAVAPIMRPGGILLLLALLRWRHREAWLLLAMACVPHTTLIHETLPLGLIPTGRRETQLFAATTLVAALLQRWAPAGVSWSESLAWNWPGVLVLGYLPVLGMLLRRPAKSSPATAQAE